MVETGHLRFAGTVLVIVWGGTMKKPRVREIRTALLRARDATAVLDKYIRESTEGACKEIEERERRSVPVGEMMNIHSDLQRHHRFAELQYIRATLEWVLGESDSPLTSFRHL